MHAVSPVGRRDRKKAQTREELRHAAVRLALEHGYEHLTVESITEAADVSVRTFFNYFATKDDALLGADPDQVQAVADALVERPVGEPPLTALRVVLSDLSGTFSEREPLWQARIQLLRANPHLWPRMFAAFSAFERALADAVAARTGLSVEADLYPGLVAAAAVASIRVAMAQWRASSERASLRDLINDAFDLLSAGLTPPASSSPPAPPSRPGAPR